MGTGRTRKETEVMEWEQSLKERAACTDIDRNRERAREEANFCPVTLRNVGKQNSVSDF